MAVAHRDLLAIDLHGVRIHQLASPLDEVDARGLNLLHVDLIQPLQLIVLVLS